MKWFDWLLTPENARKLSDELGYVLPVDEAMDNLSEELKSMIVLCFQMRN